MKKLLIIASLIMLLTICGYWTIRNTSTTWSGVDKTVVEKYARAAGRPPRKPYINTDQGDLLLFMFLLAGVSGGFVAGYYFRELFPPKKQGYRP